MNKYILWDLDGTIVESEDLEFKTNMFRYCSSKHGLNFELTPEEFVGHEAKNIFRLLLTRNGREENNQFYISMYSRWYEDAVSFIKENIKAVRPRENILDLWQRMNGAGIKNAVVTSSREDVATAYMQNIGLLPYCVSLTCINHVTNAKPDPEPYLTAMEKLKITSKDCIAIEDSVSGIKSATAAGIFTIAWVKEIDKHNYSAADIVTRDLEFNRLFQIIAGFIKN